MAMLPSRKGLAGLALFLAILNGAAASTLNDGIVVGASGKPAFGDLLLAVFDNASNKTLLVNTHWSYADIVNGVALAPLDLSSDPNFQAIRNDPLTYNLVGAYDLYLVQNPDTGAVEASNLTNDPNVSHDFPFDTSVAGNAAWGIVTTGHAPDDFSTTVGDLAGTLYNGVQAYWTSVNADLAGAGATDSSGPDSVLVDSGDPAAWDTAWGGTLGGAGLAVTSNATAIDGLGTTAKLFRITNSSFLNPDNPNERRELGGTVQLTESGQLIFTPPGGGTPINHPPVARISTPPAVDTGTRVTLNGSVSSDPDRGDSLAYAWTQTAGPATVNLDGADTSIASFLAGTLGDYTFTLAVTDNHGATASSTVGLSVVQPANHRPVAAIAAAGTVSAGSTATLDGSGSADPDGDSLAYRWVWISGPDAPVLAEADSAVASFKAAAAGDYVFKLIVTDDQGASGSGTARITVSPNQAPLARIGVEARVGAGATVVLDGGGSGDPDQNPLVYAWSAVSGPAPVSIDNASAPVASFVAGASGIYALRLLVSDGQGASGEAIARVKAGPGVALDTPTTWLVGRFQTIAVTGFQAKGNARVTLRFSADRRRFVAIGNIGLRNGGFRWKPGRKHITRDGIIQACLDTRKPATCDQAIQIVVKALPD